MQTLVQKSTLEVQLSGHKQGLYVPMNQRSSEFRCRFTPMESDPTKEFPVQSASSDMRSIPASRHVTAA